MLSTHAGYAAVVQEVDTLFDTLSGEHRRTSAYVAPKVPLVFQYETVTAGHPPTVH